MVSIPKWSISFVQWIRLITRVAKNIWRTFNAGCDNVSVVNFGQTHVLLPLNITFRHTFSLAVQHNDEQQSNSMQASKILCKQWINSTISLRFVTINRYDTNNFFWLWQKVIKHIFTLNWHRCSARSEF